MAYGSLRNATTSDGYTDAATLYCAGASVINLRVRNAAVFVQFGEGAPPPQWSESDEAFLPPADYSMPRRALRPADAVRFRSAVAGTPAQVSADAG